MGVSRKRNSQSANKKYAAETELTGSREFQPPDQWHRQQQDGEVDDYVRDVGPDQPLSEIDAAPVGYIAVPKCGDRIALEDRSQKSRDAPSKDQGKEYVYNPGERFIDAEDAQV